MLSVEGVTVDLGGRRVLDTVTFDLRAGELAGLIGANGAGKTTLLRAVLGLQALAAGSVQRVHPGPTRAPDRSTASVPLGYVPQKVHLDADVPLRSRDLVGLGLDGQRWGLPRHRRARRDAVDRMLAEVGASHLASARVGTLSGGELQRVLIAHALVARPSLLLLDEPLANLDIGSVGEIVELLSRLAREQGVGVLLSAHDMNPLLPVMDRLIYLAEGRAACGPVEQVVTEEVLSDLYGHAVRVLDVEGRLLVVTSTGSGIR